MENELKIFVLQKVTDGELGEILNFHNGNFDESRWSKAYLSSFFDSEDGSSICVVAKKENEIAGIVLGKYDKYNPGKMVLQAIAVGEKFRGNGYAKKLLGFFMEDVFKRKYVDEIILNFRESKNLEKFYQQFGFSRNESVGEYNNGDKKISMSLAK